MTFNGFGSQAAWPDGTGLAVEGEIFNGRTPIRELCQGMSNYNIIGLVISKQEVHSFPDKKNPGSEKCHFFFTLRDTSIDFINVNCWGSETFINNLANSFRINDVVEVRNPQVQSKQSGEAEQKWRPWTPSPYQLHISEPHSSVTMFSGWDTSEFDTISHMPIKASNDFYTLGDIIANDQNLHGEHVNIQAVVKCVGKPKDIITKTGKHVRRSEVILFDETCPCFPLVIWDKESTDLAQTWMPKDIVLFIADAKVTFDEYKRCMIATCDQKTIITANPNTVEAHYLYNYAQSLEYLDDDPVNTIELSVDSINLGSIKEVYNVQHLKQTMVELEKPQQFPTLGIVYAFITSFDIDSDLKQIIVSKCGVCNQRVATLSETCLNPECPTSLNTGTQQVIKTQYDLAVSLSDHTGTIENCRLTEKCAENMFGCKAVDVVDWAQSQLTEFKMQFLLERCKVYFKDPEKPGSQALLTKG